MAFMKLFSRFSRFCQFSSFLLLRINETFKTIFLPLCIVSLLLTFMDRKKIYFRDFSICNIFCSICLMDLELLIIIFSCSNITMIISTSFCVSDEFLCTKYRWVIRLTRTWNKLPIFKKEIMIAKKGQRSQNSKNPLRNKIMHMMH